jgi:hypothetical protein
MRRGLISKQVANGLEFGDNLHYLVYHQAGTSKMAKRSVFPIRVNATGFTLETAGSGGKFWKDARAEIAALARSK